MRRGAMVLAASVLLLAGCGGGAEEPAPAPTPTATLPAATEQPPVQPSGTPAPEALSRFRCEQVGEGWAAAGYLSNTAKQKATFQVTVYLGPADGTARAATTRKVVDVAAGGSVEFRIDDVPVSGEGPCRVQVLRSDP